MPPMTLGQFEHQVLLAILRNGSESYSVEIVRELERRTDAEVATAAVFMALQRLRQRGLLRDRKIRPEGGGHSRRYFRLTDEALSQMRKSRRTYMSLWDGVESLLDDPDAALSPHEP